MNIARRFLAIFWCVILSLSYGYAQESTGGGQAPASVYYYETGLGALSCPVVVSQLVGSDKNTLMDFDIAIDGEITGLNAMKLVMNVGAHDERPVMTGAKTNEDYRRDWILNWCRANPDRDLSAAIFNLWTFMASKGV